MSWTTSLRVSAVLLLLLSEIARAQDETPQPQADAAPASIAPAEAAPEPEPEPLPTIPVPHTAEREQPADAAQQEPTRLDVVVVTAQKRAQLITDVPMSMTAFSGAQLERLGVTNLRDIAAVTPSFSVVESGPGVQHLQMRGISSAFGQATVGYQLDNVSLSTFSLSQPDAATFDLASVEILRGPQGTLYGEGSMGGTVKLITQQPKLGEWEMIAKGGAFLTDGAAPGVEGNGMINAPLGDDAALRLVVGTSDLGGYIDEVDLNQPNYNRAKKHNGRLRLQWQPAGSVTLGAMALIQSIDAGSANAANRDYQRFDSNAVGIKDRGHIFSGDLNWTPEWFNVFWTASLFKRDNSVVFDARDAITSQIDTGKIPGGLGQGLDFLNPILQGLVADQIRGSPGGYGVSSDSQMSELRLSSNGGGPLVWTGGVYLRKYHELLKLNANVNLALPAIPGVPPPSIALIDVDTDSHSLATSVFGQAEYDWTEWLNTAIGARYYREKLDVAGSGQVALQDASSQDHLQFHAFTPRAVASMHAPDHWLPFLDTTLFYFSYAEGFRSGGANIQAAPEIPATYQPDRLKTLEAGTKMEFWDRLLSVELAVYHNRWVDVQVVTVPPGGSGSFTAVENQGNAAGNGIDWNFILHPAKRLDIYQSGGYIKTEFVTDSGAKRKGDPIDFVSPLTAAFGASYGFDWPSGFPGTVRADYSYASVSRYQRQGNYDYRSDPVHMLNARLSLDTEAAEFALYGRNLLNNRGALDANQPERQARARPPSYGIEMKVTF